MRSSIKLRSGGTFSYAKSFLNRNTGWMLGGVVLLLHQLGYGTLYVDSLGIPLYGRWSSDLPLIRILPSDGWSIGVVHKEYFHRMA